MGISAPLKSTPFYFGAAVSSDVPYLLPIGLGAKSYLIDLTQYERQTIRPIRPPQDNSTEPGEQSLNQEGLWRRSQSTWHLGAGQEYFDEADSVRTRVWTSKGVDVWTKRALQLLNDTEQKRVSANTNLLVLQVGTRLYIADGNEVYFTNDPTPVSPSFTAATINIAESATAVKSITTDGATVWAVLASGHLHSTAAGASTSTHLANGPLTVVGYSNGRLLAANANVLYEVSRAGALTTIWTHPNPNFVWNIIASAPNAVYVGGTSVDRSELYSITNLDATGAFAPPVLATTLPDGETINSIEYYAGAILLGTSRGLRVAQIGSNNTVSYGPVVTIPGGVVATEGQGEFVWFSWSNYDGSSTGLGRANLAQFTDTLVPAYASDLMATAQGTVLSVCTVGTRRYFAVSGSGFYGQNANYVASGQFNAGKIRYGTTEKKIVTALDLRHDALPSGCSITASVIDEAGTIKNLGASSSVGTLSPGSPLTVDLARTETFQVSLTLTRTTTTTTPVLRRWTVYAKIAPVLQEEIIVPIIMHTRVHNQLGEGQPIWYDTLAEFQYLEGLANSKITVLYQEGQTTYSVYVSELRLKPSDWTENRAFFQGIIFVRLVTLNTQ